MDLYAAMFSDDEEQTPQPDEATEPGYEFAGFDVVASDKVMLTPSGKGT